MSHRERPRRGPRGLSPNHSHDGVRLRGRYQTHRLGFDGKDFDRWSGVIVSEDGYLLTCAHTEHLPGERLTVRLADGRDADAVALGTNPITDIALVKITTPGSWPFAEIAESSTLKPGDPVVLAGYPAIDKGQWLMERTPKIAAATVKHPLNLLWHHTFDTKFIHFYGGMSGGGVFNRQGRYVAAFMGETHHRSEVANLQWNDLKQIESIDTATGIPHPLRMAFVAPSQGIAQSVVEWLVDSKSVGIGTIVDTGGWILTKASVLDGKLSCRLPDQPVNDHATPRHSAFAEIFGTDIKLLGPEVGCPVIDRGARIRGVAITSRGRNETQRGPTSVLPSHIVRRVTSTAALTIQARSIEIQHHHWLARLSFPVPSALSTPWFLGRGSPLVLHLLVVYFAAAFTAAMTSLGSARFL
ncbi:serine protease [Stieleria sp. TO1_6]|uniref:S1 family peptidase n=1 Tax=Stieleria tagensis TaxID=2956795 RepID=UPI00209AC094|nr:serine protease [Stieleria tagensis]MCO8121526.1 serine protease [Stieleria tagensis]